LNELLCSLRQPVTRGCWGDLKRAGVGERGITGRRSMTVGGQWTGSFARCDARSGLASELAGCPGAGELARDDATFACPRI